MHVRNNVPCSNDGTEKIKSTFHILQAAAQYSNYPQNEDVLKLCIALAYL
jgi:hypothetical protein